MNIIPPELTNIILNHCDIRTLGTFGSVSKEFYELSSVEIIQQVKHQIIEIFSDYNIMKYNAVYIYEKLKPIIEKIHSDDGLLNDLSTDKDNEIINTLVNSYNIHYIQKQLIFMRMNIDTSFVTHIVFSLYH